MASPPFDAAPGGLLASIRAALPSLVPSERRVAEVCLERAAEVAEWSAADLAAAAGTSNATVVRACQRLGLRGFQHLRLALAREAGAVGVRSQHPVSAGDDPETVVAAVFQTATEVLREALGPLDASAVRAAVAMLASAKRLLIVGNGGSAPVAQDAALRFLAIARPAEAPSDTIVQQLSARLLSAEDACLIITSSGANEPSLRAAEAAKASGARVIGMTSYVAAPLREYADVTLVVGIPSWPLGSDTIASRLAFLLLLNALQMCVGAARDDELGRARSAGTELLGNVVTNGGSHGRRRGSRR
jgi:RpiR family carbohydrate utilization transcriptional regulator